MKLVTVFVLASGIASAAVAGQPVGVLKNVSGIISISGDGFVARAGEGTAVTNGSSVLVASNGKATLVLNNGCSVPLAASQHLVVNAKLSCDQVHASVKQLFPAYKVAQAPVGPGLPSGGAAAGAGGAAATGTAGAAGAAGAAAATGAAAAGAAAAGGILGGLGVAGTVAAVAATVAVVSEVTKDNQPVSAQ